MYYLLKPDATVWWTDISEQMIARARRDHPELDIDLGRLEWKRAERTFDAGTLNIALRKGEAVAQGLTVAAGALVPLDYYRDMVAIEARTSGRDLTTLPHADLFEALMPGWTEQTRQLDNDVAKGQTRIVARAQQDLNNAFAEPLSPELVEHWQKLGGALPPEVPPGGLGRV
ncbi:class I SAM-dependent methyltransferase [Mycolicibacterium palauense]|uniref:hypothetical protein n=1 Tax=Mycolicibacterium palauense TaxID=2034511 RepID=UPI000BFEFFF2|nr:hypothetical protein [Mycolicibacterium palauense]